MIKPLIKPTLTRVLYKFPDNLTNVTPSLEVFEKAAAGVF